ncbi:MAG: oligopeptide/dipeptide ABC transporter ATP-binding protein, partial [Acidimicrobiales bacterium]
EISLGSTRLDNLSNRRLREQRSRMQMIFQDPNDALDPRMTVRQSIEEPLRVLGRLRGRGSSEIAEVALDSVGLPAAVASRRPHELSGGQRQRVNIARAMTVEPELLLCDEVVSALDVSIQADILKLLARLQAEIGLAYLFISHDLGVVATVSDRIGVMYLGRIVEVGAVDDVVGYPLHPYTEALLSAEPEALPQHLKHRNRIVLQGDIPSPISPPSGCGFRTRCRFAQPLCAEEVPILTARPDGHAVACHFADELELVGRQTAHTTSQSGHSPPTSGGMK